MNDYELQRTGIMNSKMQIQALSLSFYSKLQQTGQITHCQLRIHALSVSFRLQMTMNNNKKGKLRIGHCNFTRCL